MSDASEQQPGIDWLTRDALRMADHVEQGHEGNPDLVSLECESCREIMHEAQRNIEARAKRTADLLRDIGHRPEERA